MSNTKKFIFVTSVIIVSAVMCVMLCSCNEYKEAQDELHEGITSMMSEASDLKSTFDEQASGVDDFFNDITGGGSNANG